MALELLAIVLVFVSVFVVTRLVRRRRGSFARSGSTPVQTLRVEVARTFEKKKRDALAAATRVLR